MELVCIEDLVPQDHLLRKMNKTIAAYGYGRHRDKTKYHVNRTNIKYFLVSA